MKSISNIKYMPQLDGLRALAILGVLPVHFLAKEDIWLHSYMDTGNLGVKLFFVLSGFLIGSTLLAARRKIESGNSSIKQTLVRFYIRRSLRLFPLYYLYLLLSLFLLPPVRDYIFWFATYTQNILFFKEPLIFSQMLAHLWTLAIEEQFYLLAPIFVLITPTKHLLTGLTCLVFGALIFRLLSLSLDMKSIFLLPAQMDVLCMGMLTAYISTTEKYRYYIPAFKRLTLISGLVITLLCTSLKITNNYDSVIYALSNTGLGLLFSWVILSAAYGFNGFIKTILEFKPLTFLGKISYGVYILHFNVPGLLRELVLPILGWQLSSNAILNFIIFSVVSIAIATISWFTFEHPILSLKNRYKM